MSKIIKIVVVRALGACVLYVDGKEVKHVVRHSPTGMEVGYGGSGPADAARSILHMIYPPEFADRNYQDFKWKFVATWPKDQDRFEVDIDIEEWERSIQQP